MQTTLSHWENRMLQGDFCSDFHFQRMMVEASKTDIIENSLIAEVRFAKKENEARMQAQIDFQEDQGIPKAKISVVGSCPQLVEIMEHVCSEKKRQLVIFGEAPIIEKLIESTGCRC